MCATNFQRFPDLCIVLIEIQNQTYKALLDSGSQVSLVTEETLKKSNLTSNITRAHIPAASWANEALSFKGHVCFPFKLASWKEPFKFYVVDHLTTQTDIILGLDWLKEAQATMSYSPSMVSLRIKNREVPLVPATKHKIPYRETKLQVYTVGQSINAVWGTLRDN